MEAGNRNREGAKRETGGEQVGGRTENREAGERAAAMRCIYIGAGTTAKWWARQDSNLRASGYEPGALPLSYGPRKRF